MHRLWVHLLLPVEDPELAVPQPITALYLVAVVEEELEQAVVPVPQVPESVAWVTLVRSATAALQDQAVAAAALDQQEPLAYLTVLLLMAVQVLRHT